MMPIQTFSSYIKKAAQTLCFGIAIHTLLATPLLARNTPDMTAEIDKLFSTWDHDNTPGAAVIVIQGGKVIHRKGYGVAHLEYGIPITTETKFHAASVSKQFTAFAVAMLADQKKLDIKSPVHDYIPEVPHFDWPITLEHMLHHTSGLRDVVSLFRMQGRNISDVSTDEHIMRLITQQRDLNFEPNTRFMYSNANYTLLSKVVAKVSGKSFREWTTDEIFKPLGMTDSHFNDDYTEIVSGRAYSYLPRSKAEQENGKTAYAKFPMNFSMVGSTGLLTTVDDLAKWMDNLMTGALGGTELRDRMIEKPLLKNGAHIDYGYGLNISRYKGHPSISHGGVDAGFRSSMLVLPEQKLGIAILGNSTDIPALTLAQNIADLFLPAQEAAPAKEEKNQAKPSQRVAADITITPNQYSARYIMEDGTFLHITEREKGINLQVGPTALKLYPETKKDFFITEADAGVLFNKFEDGAYQQATLRNAGALTKGKRISAAAGKAEQLAEYAGRYYIPEIERFLEITVKGEGLATWTAGVEGIGVSFAGKDHFINPQKGVTLKFQRGKDGKVMAARASLGRIQNMLFEKVSP